jgi:hypothetical protein
MSIPSMDQSSTHTNIHPVPQTGMRVIADRLVAARVEAPQQLPRACVMRKAHIQLAARLLDPVKSYIQGLGDRYRWFRKVTGLLLRRGWAQAFLWFDQQVRPLTWYAVNIDHSEGGAWCLLRIVSIALV